jgi:hypothetical protein
MRSICSAVRIGFVFETGAALADLPAVIRGTIGTG